jgi:hypothetical protein
MSKRLARHVSDTATMIAKLIVPAAFAFFVCSSAFAQTKCHPPPPGMSSHSDLIVWVNITSVARRTENSCAREMRAMKVIGQRASNEPFTTGSTCAIANGSN